MDFLLGLRRRWFSLLFFIRDFPIDLYRGWISSIPSWRVCARLCAQPRQHESGNTRVHNLEWLCAQRGTTSQRRSADQFLRGTTKFWLCRYCFDGCFKDNTVLCLKRFVVLILMSSILVLQPCEKFAVVVLGVCSCL